MAERLNTMPDATPKLSDFNELKVFYHPNTLQSSHCKYLLDREANGRIDNDSWIRGGNKSSHRPLIWILLVYTLPPNQAVSESQVKINQKRNQVPPKRMLKLLYRRRLCYTN